MGQEKRLKFSASKFPALRALCVLLSQGCSEEFLESRPPPRGLRAPQALGNGDPFDPQTSSSPQERNTVHHHLHSLPFLSLSSLLISSPSSLFRPFSPTPFPAFSPPRRKIFNALKKDLIFNVIDSSLPHPTPFLAVGPQVQKALS